jgi:hypothetical protein
MSNLKKIDDAQLSGELERILTEFISKDPETTKAQILKTIDEAGLIDPRMVQLVGVLQKSGNIKQMLFRQFSELNTKLLKASGGTPAAATAKAPKVKKEKAPVDPNAPKKESPIGRRRGLDMAAPRGANSPYLLKYGIEGVFPAPIARLWTKTDSAPRRLHETLAAAPLTLEALITKGAELNAATPPTGWTEPAARKHWTYFQGQYMLLAGWTLKIDETTKAGQMVAVEANATFEAPAPAPAPAPSAPAAQPSA